MGDHMRLLITRGDWSTLSYIPELKRNQYTELFFHGYKDHSDGDGSKVWDYNLAKKKAKFKGMKFGQKKKKAAKKKKKRKNGFDHLTPHKLKRGDDGKLTF
jgi:hypothetical protein